jgi:hypothetical protein
MKIRDLPRQQLEGLLTICAEAELRCTGILDFDIEDLEPYIRAAAEDRDRRIEVRRKWLALTDEVDGLIDPIRTEFPNLEFEQQIEHLSGPDRARADAIDCELLEMAHAPVVTRDRQRWHGDVETEIQNQLPSGSTSVKKIVAAVLSRDPTYPTGPVQRYVEYLLQLPILLGLLNRHE